MQIDTDKLVEEFEKNPVGFMAAAGGLFMGMSKIIQAVGQSRGSHAYAKQVNHKIRQDKKRHAKK